MHFGFSTAYVSFRPPSSFVETYLIDDCGIKAKILRMSYDPEAAIRVLQDGLKPDRTYVFREADTLVRSLFPLAHSPKS